MSDNDDNTATAKEREGKMVRKNVMTPEERFKQRLIKVQNLKDYAVANNYDVDDKLIDVLNQLQDNAEKKPIVSSDLGKLDRAISDLTQTTYPITIDNIPEQDNTTKRYFTPFRLLISALAIFGLLMAVLGFWLAKSNPQSPFLGNSILAASLGFLGAIVYGFFNILGVIPRGAFNEEDRFEYFARLILGLLLGWVCYFAFAQQQFDNFVKPTGGNDATKILVILPFIAGYSTSLVVGILNKTISAIELTLGLEDKRNPTYSHSSRKRGKVHTISEERTGV